MTEALSKCAKLVYVRYKDHVFFKNASATVGAVEREAVGWVREENEEVILLEHDRATLQGSSGFNGVAILKSCIIEVREIHEVPLQKKLECSLNSQTTESTGEFALKPEKRKTQPSRNQ